MNIELNKKLLKSLYLPSGDERVGFITNDGIEEVLNTCLKPDGGFLVSDTDIARFDEDINYIGTWHTHPGQDSNLSGEDYRMFKSWPDHYHFIIGSDGVRCFKYDESKKAIVEL